MGYGVDIVGGLSGGYGADILAGAIVTPTSGVTTSTGTGILPGDEPLNLFLVSITLPDVPFTEEEPEEAALPLNVVLSGEVTVPDTTEPGDLILVFGFHRGSEMLFPSDFERLLNRSFSVPENPLKQTEFVLSKVAEPVDVSRAVQLSQLGKNPQGPNILRMQACVVVLRSEGSFSVDVRQRYDTLTHPLFGFLQDGHVLGFANAVTGVEFEGEVTSVSVSSSWPNAPLLQTGGGLRLGVVTRATQATGDEYTWSSGPAPWTVGANGHIRVTAEGEQVVYHAHSEPMLLFMDDT